jgi:hypothetical protein
MKLYGNLNNRFDENHYFNGTKGNLTVGTLCTIYDWSDRHAYEVIEVEDQEHITIRQLKAIRTDNYGMSDAQDYRYESNPNAHPMKIALRNGQWREVNTFTKEGYENACNRNLENFKTFESAEAYVKYHYMMHITEKQFERMMAGKTIRKYGPKVNISFGVADEYYDYSF